MSPRNDHDLHHPEGFNFLPFPLAPLLRDLIFEQHRDDWDVTVRFASGRIPLASIRISRASRVAPIRLSNALNRPDLPEAVMRFLLRHELLHLEFPVRPAHSEAFWAREAALAPDRGECWAWLYEHLGHCLATNGRDGSACVRPNRVRRHA